MSVSLSASQLSTLAAIRATFMDALKEAERQLDELRMLQGIQTRVIYVVRISSQLYMAQDFDTKVWSARSATQASHFDDLDECTLVAAASRDGAGNVGMPVTLFQALQDEIRTLRECIDFSQNPERHLKSSPKSGEV